MTCAIAFVGLFGFILREKVNATYLEEGIQRATDPFLSRLGIDGPRKLIFDSRNLWRDEVRIKELDDDDDDDQG